MRPPPKVKTERYRLLHTVREGPDHERAALRLHTWGEYLPPEERAAPDLGWRFPRRPERTG